MNYEMRKCEESDIGFLWDKFNESFEECSELPKDKTEEEFLVFKITDEKGNIIGGCVLDIDETRIAEFNSLWVDERYRRRGLGTALICEAEKKAGEKGCREIINAYTFDFQEARSLFEKLGYTLIGITKDWPQEHECYTLIKDLGCSGDENISSGQSDEVRFGIVSGNGEDGEAIHRALEAVNGSVVPRSHPYMDLNRKLVDDHGNMISGCISGVSGWNTWHIDMIWVDEQYRGRGIGTELITEIEREAKEAGAYLARAGVLAARARFFRKQGFSVNIIFENGPEWHDMLKRL